MSKRAPWRKATVSIAVNDGVSGPRREDVAGYVADGLPLAVTPSHGLSYFDHGPWTVTHLRTGLAPGVHTQRLADAKRAAEALSALGGWDRTAEEITADESLRRRACAVMDAFRFLEKTAE